MTTRQHVLCGLGVLATGALLHLGARAGGSRLRRGPYALGKIIAESTNVVVMRVEKVDKEKNLIIYRKVRDLKGKHPTDVIKHNIGRGGFNPREWQYPMDWAEVGKTAVFFHNGGGQRDLHRQLLVSVLRRRRMVEPEPRRTVPAAQLLRQRRQARRRRHRDAGRQGGDRPLHGGRQQGRPAPAPGQDSAVQGQPQDSGLQPQARFRRLGRRGLSPHSTACPASPTSPP